MADIKLSQLSPGGRYNPITDKIAGVRGLSTKTDNLLDISNIVNYLNVQDYGATGDGSTDDSAAIQQAINAAVASPTKKTVFFPNPPVAYAIGEALVVSNGIVLLGENRKGGQLSRIKPISSYTGNLITTLNYGSAIQLYVQIIGLFLDGSSTTLNAIEVMFQQSLIRDCTIANCFTYGIHIAGFGGGSNQQALNNTIQDNYLYASGSTKFYDGILLDYHTADTKLTGNYVEQCNDASLRSRAYNDIVVANHFFNSVYHYYSETSNDKIFNANYCEFSTKASILVDGGASDNQVLNGVFTSNVFRNINTTLASSGIMIFQGSFIDSLVVCNNALREDISAGYTAAYFVFFNSITPSDTVVVNNVAESGLITTAQTNATFNMPQTITGSRGGNVALANLLSGLEAMGIIIDSTT